MGPGGAPASSCRCGWRHRLFPAQSLTWLSPATMGGSCWRHKIKRRKRTMTNHLVTTMAELEAMYAKPMETPLLKELDHIGPHYHALIEAAPFVALATVGPEGLAS